MDRLARNLDDLRKLVQSLTKRGIRIEFVHESLAFTGEDSPMANLMLSVMGAFAEFERALIRDRTKSGVATAQKKGTTFGVAPKLSEKQIEQAQRMRDRGISVYKIAEHFDVAHTTIYNWTSGPKRPRKR